MQRDPLEVAAVSILIGFGIAVIALVIGITIMLWHGDPIIHTETTVSICPEEQIVYPDEQSYM